MLHKFIEYSAVVVLVLGATSPTNNFLYVQSKPKVSIVSRSHDTWRQEQ